MTIMKRRHASLSRPYGHFVESLPDDVSVQTPKTPWQRICEVLVDNPGQWFKLDQTYKGGSASALNSARKVLEADYDSSTSTSLSSAHRLIDAENDRYEIFLMVNPESLAEDDG